MNSPISRRSSTSALPRLAFPLVAATVFLSPLSAHAQLVTAHSSYWTPLTSGGNGIFDPEGDQQTGDPGADFVGRAGVPSSYIAFTDTTPNVLTDGTLYFRTRHSADADGDYTGQLWVGIEANGDSRLDLFVGVDRSGSQNTYGILIRNPGTDTNTSPSTTSIDNKDLAPSRYALTANNYNYSQVSAANYDGITDANVAYAAGAGPDYFLSFAVPFQDIVNNLNTTGTGRPTAISINQNSNLKFVFLTAQQSNALNQDFNGIQGTTGDFPFNDPTPVITSLVVPEPATALLFLPGLLLLRRRRN